MGNTHDHLLLALAPALDQQRRLEAVVATHAAYMEALERMLGAPANSLTRTDAEAVKLWMTGL